MTLSPSRPAGRSLLLSSLCAALMISGASTAQDALGPAYPAGSVRGEAALLSLGESLEGVAAEHGLSATDLAERLRSDDSLWVDGAGKLYYACLPLSPAIDEPSVGYAGSIPTGDAFTLNSRPGANKTIYLDFTGHHSVSNSWGHNIVFPPYNTSGGSGTFSNGELNDIIIWWQHVSEDFSPFDVNVTTEEPPLSALIKSNSGDVTWGVRCVNTQPTDGFGNGIGGIAQLNSFNDNIDNPVFVFNKGTNTGAMSASHEVGHAFGLQHDGLNGQSYHPGSGSGETSWGPIMGAPFGSTLVQWSNGDYAGATSSQNDVNIITNSSNGVNWWADDHGDAFGQGSPLPPAVGCPVPTPGTLNGLINSRTDVDAFTFTTTGGSVTVSALRYLPAGNLDLELRLLNSGGTTLFTVNDANDSDAILTTTLTAGTYTILVDGVGKSGSYSDYGSLGQYSVSASLPGISPFTDLGGGVAAGTGNTPILTASGLPCPNSAVTINMVLAPANKPAYLVYGLAEFGIPFKGGVLVPNTAVGGGIITQNTGFLGFISQIVTWPASAPSGLSVYMQYWVPDATAVAGYAASNGVRIYTP